MPNIDALLDRARARQELPPPAMRRAIREAAGLPLRDVAAAFDPPVSEQAVAHWELGNRFPRPEHLRQYVAILKALSERAA